MYDANLEWKKNRAICYNCVKNLFIVYFRYEKQTSRIFTVICAENHTGKKNGKKTEKIKLSTDGSFPLMRIAKLKSSWAMSEEINPFFFFWRYEEMADKNYINNAKGE